MFVSVYDIIVFETMEFRNKKELLIREKHYQKLHDSIQSKDNAKCKNCQRVFKQFGSFAKHRHKCYKLQSVVSVTVPEVDMSDDEDEEDNEI